MAIVPRTEDEIDTQLNNATAAADRGRSAFPGMIYEQGWEDSLHWVRGEREQALPAPAVS